MLCRDAEVALSDLRIKELKAELDALGVSWRGTCFEKEELVAKLTEARSKSRSSSSSSQPANSQAPTSNPASSTGEEQVRASVERMTTSAIKKELADRKVDTRALLEKSDLVARLVEERLKGTAVSARCRTCQP